MSIILKKTNSNFPVEVNSLKYKCSMLNDFPCRNSLFIDYFDFLSNNFHMSYDFDLNADILIGFGSGCLQILDNIDKIKSRVTVLISPYLDFNMFFKWIYQVDDWQNKYSELSKIDKKYLKKVNLQTLNFPQIFLKETAIKNTNLYIIFGENNRLIPLDYGLKLGILLDNTSFHLIENGGYAPFVDSKKEFYHIMDEFVLYENF